MKASPFALVSSGMGMDLSLMMPSLHKKGPEGGAGSGGSEWGQAVGQSAGGQSGVTLPAAYCTVPGEVGHGVGGLADLLLHRQHDRHVQVPADARGGATGGRRKGG